MNIIMPQLGETVAEGKIANWFKAVGDKVKAGENLFEIETDKVTMEVQATENGLLTEIRVAAGETVPVGTVVAVLGESSGKPAPAASPAAKPAPAAAKPATAPAAPVAPARVAAPTAPRGNGAAAPSGTKAAPYAMTPYEEMRTPTGQYAKANAVPDLKITPLARRLLKQGGIDINAVAQGVRSRGGWRIAASDVHAAPAHAVWAPERPRLTLREGDTVESLNKIRAQTALHLAESWREIPHAFQAVEVDFSAVVAARAQAKDAFAKHHGTALTFLPFVARAVCLALAEFPRLNASFDRDRLIRHGDVNLGFAVDLDHQGLLVPVVHHADEMNAGGIAKALARQVEKARTNKLAPGDLTGGTYSISNNGSFGTFFTMPVINAPQVATLSFDAVLKRPAVTGDTVAVRPLAMLGQSFDHRACDGAYSAQFLQKLKAVLETHPWASELA
jgi:2-oxoglutarate dehydrogenase E2 component (dihydrolipoamide succinyltransferase)